jgi:hypothetical protein
MSTIDSAQIIRTILANKGVYPGDPPVSFVFTYTNFEGRKTYAVDSVRERYRESSYVRNPILLLQHGELTDAGKQELAALNAKMGRLHSDLTKL